MSRRTIMFWAIPALLLMLQLPIFLQMPLTPDAVLYDLQARGLVQGGVLYRDIVEPNLPGVVWIHVIVRRLLGESDQVLRVFDFVVGLCITAILCRTVAVKAESPQLRHAMMAVQATLILMFYFGTSEWCHCQRDTWMLLPCLLAMATRKFCCDQFRHSAAHRPPLPCSHSRQALLLAFLEGSLWAVAFWIKPFVALPAISVMLASRRHLNSTRAWLRHSTAMIAAGAFVGWLGILWMVNAGCWTHFVEMMTSWNGDYFQAGRSRWNLERLQAHVSRFWPWALIHLPAIVISVRNRQSLLCACYLGWILQAVTLQQLFDYVHVPGVILAISICVRTLTDQLQRAGSVAAAHDLRSVATDGLRSSVVPCIAGLILTMALVSSTIISLHRLTYLRPCLSACVYGSLPLDVRDSISQSPFPCWAELEPLVDQLRKMNIADRELLAYNGNLIHLYPRLKSGPPTRFVYLDVLARCFPRRRPEMLQELERSHIRYVVANLREDGWEDELSPSCILPVELESGKSDLFFPYNQRPICRSGSYILFEVVSPPGSLTVEYFPLSQFRTRTTAGILDAGIK